MVCAISLSFVFFCGFVGDYDPKEDGRIACPVSAEVVADSHNSGGESLGRALNAGLDLQPIGKSFRDIFHNPIISGRRSVQFYRAEMRARLPTVTLSL